MSNWIERLSAKEQLLIGIVGAIITFVLIYIIYYFKTGFIVGFLCGLFSALSFYMLVTYSFNAISKK